MYKDFERNPIYDDKCHEIKHKSPLPASQNWGGVKAPSNSPKVGRV